MALSNAFSPQPSGDHSSMNPQTAVVPNRKNEWLCFPQDALEPTAAQPHTTSCGRFQKLRTWPGNTVPKQDPFLGPNNGARLTSWCKKTGPFSGLKIIPALSRFFAEAASHLSCLG